MRKLLTFLAAGALLASLSGCVPAGPAQYSSAGPAALRGFSVKVDQALADRVPQVHVKTCGTWGCHEQDVPLHISGPTSAVPCNSAGVCGMAQLPGPGPGFGYAPVPGLTMDPVTVTVSFLDVQAEITVRPRGVCPGAASSCADPTPQAEIRIAADSTIAAF